MPNISYRSQSRVLTQYADLPPKIVLGNTKNFFCDHLEKILACTVIVVTLITHFVVLNKLQFLDVFYLPILLTSYFLGRKAGISAAIFSVLTITYFVMTSPTLYMPNEKQLFSDNYSILACNLTLWAGFLILTSIMVGTLYERNTEKSSELRRTYEGVLEILTKLIDSSDKYTKGHSLRVAEISTEVAINMNLPVEQVETIRVAALLHDIGKVDISTDVILKAAKLSDKEIEELKSHVNKSGTILKPFKQLFKDAVIIVLAHHKYYNELGYGEKPTNLEEELARSVGILTIVDAYDAMISDRPYRAGRTPKEAIMEIMKASGEQFDPKLVKIFVNVMKDKFEKH